MKKINIFLSIILIFIIACIIVSPARFISAAMNGISAWTFNILPSVLPFMIFTKILSDLGVVEKVCSIFSKPIRKIYRTSNWASYTFFMSILSGYPVGSKIIADLYESDKITKQDAYKMSSFCSNSGPMFIVGSVGVGMLLSPTAGYIILISHILSAIINGILYRNIKVEDEKSYIIPPKTNNSINIGDIVLSAVQSILSVGAIVAVFFIIIECLSPLFNILPSPFPAILEGFIEITKGCISTAKFSSLFWSTAISSLIISFGGLSTIIQSTALLKRVKMPIWIFTLQKFTQSLISFAISVILCLIFF